VKQNIAEAQLFNRVAFSCLSLMSNRKYSSLEDVWNQHQNKLCFFVFSFISDFFVKFSPYYQTL
jgi:hypothetical protein